MKINLRVSHDVFNIKSMNNRAEKIAFTFVLRIIQMVSSLKINPFNEKEIEFHIKKIIWYKYFYLPRITVCPSF